MRWFTIVLFIIISCNSFDRSNSEENVESQDRFTVNSVDNYYVWSVNSDSMIKRKNSLIKPEYYDIDTLIKGLNYKFPQIQLRKIKLSNDTLYVRIDDAEFLTQRMGTSGPIFYKANVFFNLTSLPKIKYVNLDFDEGDHAYPEVLRPQDYNLYTEN